MRLLFTRMQQRLISHVAAPDSLRLAFPGIPIALCMALLTSIGPFVQQFAEAALTDGRSEVVEYGEIYRFLSLRDQLTSVAGYAYGFAGLLAGFAASGRRTPIGIALAATLWLWGLLCAVDLALTLRGAEAASPLALQIVFDGAGAMISGGILATLLCLAIAAGRTMSAEPRRVLLQSCIVAIGGLLVSGTTYVLVTFAHRPAPSWIEVTASLPLNGSAIGTSSPGALDDMRTLDWLPRNGVIGRLSAWTVKRPLVANWRPGENGSWRIGISAFERCLSPDLASLSRVPPQAVLDARSALALRFDADLTMLETDKHASVDVDLKNAYTQFSMEPGAKGRGPEVTNLTGAGVSARLKPSETTGLALSTSFLTGRTPRQMTQRGFSIRGSRGSLRLFLRPTRFDLDQKTCRPIRWRSEGYDPDGARRFVADVDGSTARCSCGSNVSRKSHSVSERGQPSWTSSGWTLGCGCSIWIETCCAWPISAPRGT